MENLQNKFPNLSNLEIYIPRPKPGNEINLLITENKQSKINKFILSAGLYQNIKFYCTNFENLIEIKITLYDIIKNIENSFPLFNKDNNIIFKSLKILELKNKSENKIHISIIEAVFKNMDKMPNLKEFVLFCKILDNIKKDFYDEFLKKILRKKLKRIYLAIRCSIDEIYTKEEIYDKKELESLYKELNINNYHNLNDVYIKKFNNNTV